MILIRSGSACALALREHSDGVKRSPAGYFEDDQMLIFKIFAHDQQLTQYNSVHPELSWRGLGRITQKGDFHKYYKICFDLGILLLLY